MLDGDGQEHGGVPAYAIEQCPNFSRRLTQDSVNKNFTCSSVGVVPNGNVIAFSLKEYREGVITPSVWKGLTRHGRVSSRTGVSLSTQSRTDEA